MNRAKLLLAGGCLVCLLVVASTIPAADPRLDVPGAGDTPAGSLDNQTSDSRMSDSRTDPSDETPQSTPPANGTIIRVDEPLIVGQPFRLNASVGNTPLPNATVYRNGQRVNTTNASGAAVLEPRQEPGQTDLRVERGSVTGERTVEAPEPSLVLDSPLLFPGSVASVTVTADGKPVEGATVMVDGEQVATTDESGTARIRLPLTDTVTVTAEAGSVTMTTTVGNLYLRLTAVVVLIPGFGIGVLWASRRLLALFEMDFSGQPRSGEGEGAVYTSAGASPFILLGAMLAGMAAAVETLFGNLGSALAAPFGGSGGREFSWPSAPDIGVSLSWPTLSVSLLGGVGTTLSQSSGSTADDRFSATAPDSELIDEILAERNLSGDQAELRAIWGAFLDSLGIDDEETLTAGEVGRHALAAGFPAESVRRLVATFREVEYGEYDPSLDRVTTARAALLDLQDNDPQEGTE
jgi:hypothetical protein